MKLGEVKNIFDDLPEILSEEFFETILAEKNFKLERIVSHGHKSPSNFWYDQEQSEFVLVVSGAAILTFDDGKNFNLKSGDYLVIPAHKKHRVDWTDPDQKTFWLALYY
jgi:cupin 2 domain-containing protein